MRSRREGAGDPDRPALQTREKALAARNWLDWLGPLKGFLMLDEQPDFARGLLLPPLRNMTAGEPLGPFLLSEPLLRTLHGGESTIDGAYVGKLMAQMGEVLDKGARILFKSLGGLLAMQEQIAERWALPPAPPEPTPVEPAPAAEGPAPSGE